MLFTSSAAKAINKTLEAASKKALVLFIVHAGPTGYELHFGTTNEEEGLREVDKVCLKISDEDLNTLYERGVLFETDNNNKVLVTKKGQVCNPDGCCHCDGSKKKCKTVNEPK